MLYLEYRIEECQQILLRLDGGQETGKLNFWQSSILVNAENSVVS